MIEENPHNLEPLTTFRKIFESKDCKIYLYDHVLILEVKEGVTFCYENGFSLLLKCLSVLGTKPWFLISNRINSYSLNPNDYKYLQQVPTLKGIAVVYKDENLKQSANLEKNFFRKPFKAFINVEKACKWGFKLLED